MAAKGRIFYALLFFVAALTFFWPIPRTIAVRHISLALSVITLWIIVYNSKNIFRQNVLEGYAKTKLILISLALTTFWFYFVAIFVSPETEWSLKELNGQWLIALVTFCFGFTVIALDVDDAKKVFMVSFAVIFLHSLFIDLEAVKLFTANGGVVPHKLMGLTEGPDKANYLTNWILAVIGVELLFRIIKKTRVIPVDSFFIYLAGITVLLASYLETMRFGFIGLFFTFCGFTALYLFWSYERLGGRKTVAIAALFILSFTAIGYANIKADKRWDSVAETVSIALDTEHNKAWLDWHKYQKPVLSDGRTVDHSNYTRPAMAKEGFILITENPFGIGYGRNAFGHGLKAKYGEGGGHSHSGIIDLGIGTGFIGMGLWVVFLVSLMYYGFRSFKKDESYFGMILLFIVSGFFFRMIVDSVIRDHMLEQFMFLVGLLLALSIKEINEKNSTSTV